MNVNCANINGGFSFEALSDITGMPTLSLKMEGLSADEFYNSVVEATNQPLPWPMVTGCDVAT